MSSGCRTTRPGASPSTCGRSPSTRDGWPSPSGYPASSATATSGPGTRSASLSCRPEGTAPGRSSSAGAARSAAGTRKFSPLPSHRSPALATPAIGWAWSGHQLEPPYLLLVALHARLERPETVKALGKSHRFVHDKNGAILRAHAEPLLSTVAPGTRLGEHAQVKTEGAVLDLDTSVRRGDENPFLQRRRIVRTRAVLAPGELKARVEADVAAAAWLHDPVPTRAGRRRCRRAGGKGENDGHARGRDDRRNGFQ